MALTCQYNQNFADGRSVNRDNEFARTYLFRPIPLSSKFTMGQYDLSSNLYDTFHFTGASLESDESMLPPDLQGYAPNYWHRADQRESNCGTKWSCTLSNHCRAGPLLFLIWGTVSGQLDVTVEEEDGRTSTFRWLRIHSLFNP